MKQMKIWLSLALLASWTTTASAQKENKYLDDAYFGKQDIQRIEAENKRKAAERHAELLRKQQEEEARRSAALEEYKRKRRSQEIDAYNGHIIIRDEDGEEIYSDGRRPASSEVDKGGVYGEYSERLRRFHSDGNTIIINSPSNVYIGERGWDGDYTSRYSSSLGWNSYWDSSWDWNFGYSPSWFYPRYDGYYYPYQYSYWGVYPAPWSVSYAYTPWHFRFGRGYYDGYYGYPYSRYSWYDPYYSYYGGYYGGFYGGYYDGYYSGRANRAYYEHYYNNPYSGYNSNSEGNRSRRISSYEAYDVVRNSGYQERNNGSGYYSGESWGTARGGYTGRGRYNEPRSRAFDDLPRPSSPRSNDNGSSYSSESSSSSSSSSPSYNGGSSRSGGSGSGRVRRL